MAFDRAKTSLGFIEEKLQRLLGLAGTISASFEPELKPIIVTADMDNPGAASFRGRHFAFASDLITVGGANTTIGLRFGVPSIVECMWVAGSPIDGGGAGVPTRFPVHYISPNPPNAFPATTTVVGTWVDNKTSDTADQPPLFSNGTQADAASFALIGIANRVWVAGFAGGSILNGLMTTPPGWRGMHLPANAQLRCPLIHLGAGTSLTWGVMGRIA
jgi:hypothetical protein